jgi:hypothetical protein
MFGIGAETDGIPAPANAATPDMTSAFFLDK